MPQDDIPAGQEAAPAEAPAPLTAEQIAEIVTKSIDARVPGLQSGYDKRINDLETQLRQASMDEDQIAEEREATLQKELESARIEADIQKAARIYPDAFPVFEEIRQAANAEEQLKILTEKLTPPAPAAPVEDAAPAEEGDGSPPVDPNQARTDQPLDPNGMNADKANRILDAVGDYWPGRG